jgi:rubrerythrin
MLICFFCEHTCFDSSREDCPVCGTSYAEEKVESEKVVENWKYNPLKSEK